MSYSSHGVPMIPFYIYYSIFGFQRIGDFIWAAADMRARGFLVGGTSGRTTLNGEGLQHEDGHSHILASTFPTCVAYDPTYGYELAVIIQDGLRRMVQEDEEVFYYLTTLNENYIQPEMPDGVEEGIRRGIYPLKRSSERGKKKRVQLLGCGSILREVEAAAEMLEERGIAADVWSVTSFTELRKDGLAVERHNLLHPGEKHKKSYVEEVLGDAPGPVIASTDYMRAFADQIRPWVKAPYTVLGTDGLGRSDTREALRHHFEVDRNWITFAALSALAEEGAVPVAEVKKAMDELGIDPEKPQPVTV
jgi:pyruvate dehydrogenase E1 component